MVEKNPHEVALLSKKAAANRRNAQLSTGPKTEEGKSWSRRNALKHGILASVLLVTQGEGAEDPAEFDELLGGLRRDLAPVGRLEEMLVETIAACWWRRRRALRCEAGLVRRSFFELDFDMDERQASIRDHLSLPLGEDLDRILRYETSINRQWAYAINQLERLQRARKGEHVPAPVSVQVSADQ
jgi:hypothetical protein